MNLNVSTRNKKKIILMNERNKRTYTIIPFILASGTYNYTNGAINPDYGIKDPNVFKKVINGDQPVLCIWRGSTFLVPNEGKTDAAKDFIIGKNYEVYIDSQEDGIDISDNLEGTSGMDINISSSISAYTYSKEDIAELSMFDGYIIPELNEYIYFLTKKGSEREADGNTFKYTLEFVKPVDIVAGDVKIDEMFLGIQNSPNGEGFAFPKVLFSNDKNGAPIKTLMLDENKLQNKPITSIQVSFENSSGVASIYGVGRPLNEGTNQGHLLGEWGILLNNGFEKVIGNDVSGITVPAQKVVTTYDSKYNIGTYYKEWKGRLRSKYDDFERKKWEKQLVENNSSGWDKVENEIYEKEDAFGEQFYLQPNIDVRWKARADEAATDFYIPSGYFIRNYNFWNINIFAYKDTLQISPSWNEQIPWSISQIPIVGPFIKLFTLGVPIGWTKDNSKKNLMDSLKLFISRAQMRFARDSLWSFEDGDYVSKPNFNDGDVVLPMDQFSEETSEGVLSRNETRMSYKWKITDKTSQGTINNGAIADGRIIYTKDFGKNLLDEAGQRDTYFQWNINGENNIATLPLDPDYGFALDKIVIQALAKTPIRITLWSGEEVVTSYRSITTSVKSDSINEWTTVQNLSVWDQKLGLLPDNGLPIITTPPIEVEPDFIYLNGEKHITNQPVAQQWQDWNTNDYSTSTSLLNKSGDGDIRSENYDRIFEFDVKEWFDFTYKNEAGDILIANKDNYTKIVLVCNFVSKLYNGKGVGTISTEDFERKGQYKGGKARNFTVNIDLENSTGSYSEEVGDDYAFSAARSGIEIKTTEVGNVVFLLKTAIHERIGDTRYWTNDLIINSAYLVKKQVV